MLYFSLPILGIVFIINSIILFVFGYWLVILYAILLLSYVLVSALPAKNVARDFQAVELWLSSLFLLASVIAEAFATIAFFNGLFGYTLVSFLEYFLLFIISNIALLISVLHVTVYGQRVSLRESASLVDNFFTEQKRVWKNELKFPVADRMMECLENGKFIPQLFDKGLFNLTVLWSCNMMGKIVDTAADEIIARYPEKRGLFRTEKGKRRNYPYQLKILGFEYSTEDKSFDVDKLWNELRNRIVHHNYKPTFDETYETLKILVSFTKEMPKNLKSWLT
ncbi:MAG: hypothetical protein QXQ94_07860 [Candidatus Bathyarchaeia archaeon]